MILSALNQLAAHCASSKTFLSAQNPEYASLREALTSEGSPEKMTLDRHELAVVEDVLEQLMSDIARSKLQMLTRLEASCERLKLRFLANMDRLSSQIRDAIENSSRYAFAEELATSVCESRLDFDLRQTPANMDRLCVRIKRLLDLAGSPFYEDLLGEDSLSEMLGTLEKVFMETRRDFAQSERVTRLEAAIRQFCVDDSKKQAFFEVSRRFETGAVSNPRKFWGDHYSQIRPVIDKLVKSQIDVQASSTEQAHSLPKKISQALRDPLLNKKYSAVSPVPGQSRVWVCRLREPVPPRDFEPRVNLETRGDEFRQHKSDSASCKSLFWKCFDVVDFLRPENPLLRVKLRSTGQFVMSASGSFICFPGPSETSWLVCKFGADFKSIHVLNSRFQTRHIREVVFVDRADSDNIAFLNEESELVVYDPVCHSLRTKITDTRLVRCEYLDCESVFVVTEDMRMGIVSLDEQTQTEWVRTQFSRIPEHRTSRNSLFSYSQGRLVYWFGVTPRLHNTCRV